MKKLFFSIILCLFVSALFAGQRPHSDSLLNNKNLPLQQSCRIIVNVGGIRFTFTSSSCAGALSAANLVRSAYQRLSEGLLYLFSTDDIPAAIE